jgi:hypothetical protein
MVACVCTVGLLGLLTSLMFGWSVWPRWITGFPVYQHLLQANQARLDHFMPTILAGMHMLGSPAVAAYALQLLLALGVALLCWRALSRGLTDRAIAMSIIGTLMVAPYAMIYDTPMIASAVVLHWRARIGNGCAIGIREVTLVIATFASFFYMVSGALPLLAPFLLLAIFVVMTASPDTSLGEARKQVFF